MVPSISLQPTVLPQETLVPEESALEASMLQVHEVPVRLAQDGSNATPLQKRMFVRSPVLMARH
jgi:hypothetical protein